MSAAALRLTKRHFNVLDLSRLVAAVAVLFWHYVHFVIPADGSPAPPNIAAVEPLHPLFALFYDYGHLAVEYFWIVSGFVFAHVYLADPQARGRFWTARIARLWPLHLLTLGVVAGLQALYFTLHGQHFVYSPNDAYHFALNIFLAHFWGFERGMTFNGPSWSLSVEIVAYAAFWALLPALRSGRLLVAGAVAFLAALLAPQFAGLKLFACIAYFFAGVGMYFGLLRYGLKAGSLAVGGLSGLALAMRFDTVTGFDFPQGALWVLSLFAVALAGEATEGSDGLTIGKRLGDASYGTYLWHFPIQLALVMMLDLLPGGRTLSQNWAVLAVYIALAVGAGFASHRWFEKPAQKAILAMVSRGGSEPAAA